MIPYECQPPSSQIGKFKKSREMTSDEYERNLVLRTEIVILISLFIDFIKVQRRGRFHLGVT
jgi:hypothetical protein